MLQPEKILEKAKLLEKSDKLEAETQYSELIRVIKSAEVIQRHGQNLTHHLATAYNNRGYLRYLAVDFDKASDDYSACLQIDPNFTIAYYNRGMVHYRLGRFEKAIEDLSKTLELDPTFEQAKIGLEKSRQDQNERNEKQNMGYFNS